MSEFVNGSILVCPECWRPVYALERGLGPMDRCGRGATAFRPLVRQDVIELLCRADLNERWQIGVAAWVSTPQAQQVFEAQRPRAGDLTICPNCGGSWTKFVPKGMRGEGAADRAYELQLFDIPPIGTTTMADLMHWLPDLVDDRPVEVIEK